jgi:hypothetical protein
MSNHLNLSQQSKHTKMTTEHKESENRIILSKPVTYPNQIRAGIHFFILQGGKVRVPNFSCRIVNFDKSKFNDESKNYRAPFYNAKRSHEDKQFKESISTLEDSIYKQLLDFRKTEIIFKSFCPSAVLKKGSFFTEYRNDLNIPIGLYTKQKGKHGKTEDVNGLAKTRGLATRPVSEIEGKEGHIILHAKLASIFIYEKEKGVLTYYLKLYLQTNEFQFKEEASSSKVYEKQDDADLYSEEEEGDDIDDNETTDDDDDDNNKSLHSPVLPVDVVSNSDYHEVLP